MRILIITAIYIALTMAAHYFNRTGSRILSILFYIVAVVFFFVSIILLILKIK